MLLCCKICHREYVASKKINDEHFICSRCQDRNREHHHNRLGLHPALLRRPNEHNAKDRISGETRIESLHPDGPRKIATLSDSSSLPKIPGFELSFQIGRGAMGSVYRAREIKTGRMVAIKVLSYDLSERADLVARFEREAYVLKALANPNIVSIIDAGRVNDMHYFAMEFVDGITLRARINQGPIDVKEACFITEQILSGLKAAHQHSIIHRDLKPENVLLAYDGDFSKWPQRVVLVDFGLVGIAGLAFDPHPNLTRSKVTMGTVNYMAPEQHIDAKRVDHRSDLYSTGVMFFEMLTKELPLGRYLLPYERGLNLPKEIDNVLSKALARTAEERYFSADQFFQDIKKIKVDQPNTDEPLKLTDNLSFKSIAYQGRYALLLVLAGLFFAFGIKLSKPQEKPAALHQVVKSKKS